MAIASLRVWILILAALMFVSTRPLSAEILQAAVQMPDGEIFAEIPQETYQEEVQPTDNLIDIWSNIEAAIQFLEHHPTNIVVRDKIQEYFRRDKSLEKVKSLPLLRHHFIRFGKRSVSN